MLRLCTARSGSSDPSAGLKNVAQLRFGRVRVLLVLRRYHQFLGVFVFFVD